MKRPESMSGLVSLATAVGEHQASPTGERDPLCDARPHQFQIKGVLNISIHMIYD